MGALGSTTIARDQGISTGAALPASTASFLYRQGRTWSFSAARTASLSDAFARGLETGGVVPAMKHFPGLGFATANTDTTIVSIRRRASDLAPGLRPYQLAIA